MTGEIKEINLYDGAVGRIDVEIIKSGECEGCDEHSERLQITADDV